MFWSWLETWLGSGGIGEQSERATQVIFLEEAESLNSQAGRARQHLGNRGKVPLQLLESPGSGVGGKKKSAAFSQPVQKAKNVILCAS